MEFALVYCDVVTDSRLINILCVFKDRPENQKGKINLVGGKIEAGETPIEAAIRELKEEAGIEPTMQPIEMGKICGTWGTVHCIKVPVLFSSPVPREGETELVCWLPWKDLKEKSNLMPNLKIIIPLMAENVKGWIIEDEGPLWDSLAHTVNVTIPVKVQ